MMDTGLTHILVDLSCHSGILDPADVGSAPWLEIVCFLPGISQNGGPPDISGLLG